MFSRSDSIDQDLKHDREGQNNNKQQVKGQTKRISPREDETLLSVSSCVC